MNTNTSTKPVVLLSEILASGNGCPVCGGEIKRARTCAGCVKTIGLEATRAVDAVIDAAAKAVAGHEAATTSSRPMNRNVVWGPVLAQVEITPGAILKIMPKGNIQPYWDGRIPVTGGHVSLFVFGAAEDAKPGDTVTALVELKTKVIQVKDKGDVTIHYVRAQVVNGVTSNMALAINDLGAPGYKLVGSLLPYTNVIEEGGRAYAVGFTAAKDIKTGAGDPREAKAILAEVEQPR